MLKTVILDVGKENFYCPRNFGDLEGYSLACVVDYLAREEW